jgi:hypothetical protein
MSQPVTALTTQHERGTHDDRRQSSVACALWSNASIPYLNVVGRDCPAEECRVFPVFDNLHSHDKKLTTTVICDCVREQPRQDGGHHDGHFNSYKATRHV